MTIVLLTETDLPRWIDTGIAARGDAHLRRLLDFARDAESGARVIWAAWRDNELLGQITLQYDSEYPPFRQQQIAEIVDLWVAPGARRNGTGKALLDHAVNHMRQRNAAMIGLGVGITADFGPAHRLYSQAGFMPDGTGLWIKGKQATAGDMVTLGDDVLMMWTKSLR